MGQYSRAGGAGIGASDTVTFTNKTISLTDNTITGTTAEFNTALTDNDFCTIAGTETLTNKTLTTPIISSISNTGTLTLPTSTDTLTGRATTDTLTNKTINTASNTITVVEADISDLGSYITASSTDTLTNKTFDANGTGNSLSNVDVADLADGTDGELITWGSDAAPTTVAAGTSGQLLTSNGAGAAPTFQNAPASAPPSVAEGRLTMATGDPTGDTSSGTTLYYTPYNGNRIGLYDGSANWDIITFSEISIAIPATTDTNYDVYIYNDGGTATLELTAWTTSTFGSGTRATAVTKQDGIDVKTGATTRRLVGIIRTDDVSGQCSNSSTQRHVWNRYNRILNRLNTTDVNAGTWTYTTDDTWRRKNGLTGRTSGWLSWIQGESDSHAMHFVLHGATRVSASSGVTAAGIGVGLDGSDPGPGAASGPLISVSSDLQDTVVNYITVFNAPDAHYALSMEYIAFSTSGTLSSSRTMNAGERARFAAIHYC